MDLICCLVLLNLSGTPVILLDHMMRPHPLECISALTETFFPSCYPTITVNNQNVFFQWKASLCLCGSWHCMCVLLQNPDQTGHIHCQIRRLIASLVKPWVPSERKRCNLPALWFVFGLMPRVLHWHSRFIYFNSCFTSWHLLLRNRYSRVPTAPPTHAHCYDANAYTGLFTNYCIDTYLCSTHPI